MRETNLTTERPCDGVLILRLNRPGALNALDQKLLGCLHDAVDAASADLDCKIVGEGRGFCAGLDLHEAHLAPAGTEGQPEVVQQMMLQKRFTGLMEKIHS